MSQDGISWLSTVAVQALVAGLRGLRVLQAAKCAVAMQDLDVPWSPSSTGPGSGNLPASASPNTCSG